MTPRIACLLAFALAGCSLGKSDSEVSTVPSEASDLTTIQTNAGNFIGGSGLSLYAPAGAHRYELSINGRTSTGETWSVLAHLDPEAVKSGRASVGLMKGPGGVGIASLTRGTSATEQNLGKDLVQASAGTLTIEFEKGRVTGAVTGAVPESLNATFEGTLGVACYVPGTGVSAAGSILSDDGTPAPVLTRDEKLESAACGTARSWARAM